MIAALALSLLLASTAAEEAEVEARQALAAGDRAEALRLFEQAIRAVDDTPSKARLRDAYLEAGWAEPPPVTLVEGTLLELHVRNEKARVYGTAADRMEREDRLHGAMILRRAICELMEADEGRVNAEQERIRSMIRKLTENPTDEDKELVAKVVRSRKEGANLLRAGRALLDERRYRAVVRLCQEIMFGAFEQEVQNEAIALRREAETRAADDVPPAEREEARAVIEDERFERLDVATSRHFLFLGPQAFVGAIPPRDRMLLDLAYIFQSDLAAQPLTADGVRICIYYQETFDFGGALAGGKLIRVGNRAIRPPVAEMLHYHELGHCIFGRGWLHHGFTEGLADFAAGFTLDALGQTPRAQQFITDARDQFVRYFLGRQTRYFLIQPYRPSAGFLFSFLPPGEAPFDWAPYRRAFHRMREAQFGSWPEREHQIMRYFGYLMATEYGPEVFETLAEWGWPVERADHRRVPDEAETLLSEVKQGEYKLLRSMPFEAAAHFRGVLAEAPDGPLAPRARYGLLRLAIAEGDGARAAELRRELGILDAFLVLGPFHARRETAHVVFPPETSHIELAEPARFGIESGIWKEARVEADGSVDLRQQGYGYPDHACAFALAYLHVGGPVEARFWTGSDDGHTLYVNGKLAEKRDTSRGLRFDDDFVDAPLVAGWNRVLLKVHNTTGSWGFLLRVTDRRGRAIAGLRASTEDHEKDVPAAEPAPHRPLLLLRDDFKALAGSRWLAAVGRFDTQNGLLRPLGNERIGLWQRFVVDPDKPRDGPANILWLRTPDLAGVDSLEIELTVAAHGGDGLPAKFGLTLDGEGENDGQSGHTFLIEPHDGKLRCGWFRYDHLLYLQQGTEVPPAERYVFRLRRIGTKWWLSANGCPIFERADAPRLPAAGLGLLTWGREPAFDGIGIERLDPGTGR